MRNIYKFQFDEPHWLICTRLPVDARVVHVGEQDGKVTVWIEFVIGAPCVTRRYLVVGTGQPIMDGLYHVGTVQMADGYVWHVYQSPVE